MIKNKIYKNLFLFTIIIVSYVGLLFFISNEGLKNPGAMPRHGAIDAEMMHQSMQIQDANIDEIQINKNLIDIK